MKKIIVGLVFLLAALICTSILYDASAVEAMAQSEGVALPVVMYHNISEKNHLKNAYCVSPQTVENDIKYLLANGYQTVSCEDILNYIDGKGELPPKPVMLTVDDGFESFYAYMYPLLKKYGCKAVISPIGKCVDFFTSSDDHNLDYAYLTWDELKEMSGSDLVEIGNHTYDLHGDSGGRVGCGRKWGECDEDYITLLNDDIGKMQRQIKQYTALDCNIFTYPYGKISDGSEEILRQMGFRIIFTCNGKVNTLNAREGQMFVKLGRFNRPSGISSSDFFAKLGLKQ